MCSGLSPLISGSPAPMQSLCPSAPAQHVPHQPHCSAAHSSMPRLCIPALRRPVPPLFSCPAFIRLCTLPLLSQQNHGAAHLSASPADVQCGQRAGAGGFWGGFWRERSLSPPAQVIVSPRFPLARCTLKYSAGSQEKRLKTTFCTPNSAEQRARASAATCRQSSPSHWDPSAPQAPHVAPVAPLLPASTGRGRRVLGANPLRVCVRVCACVCVCSGCLAANGAWEARTGG